MNPIIPAWLRRGWSEGALTSSATSAIKYQEPKLEKDHHQIVQHQHEMEGLESEVEFELFDGRKQRHYLELNEEEMW